jgi:hypothetical protein
VNAITMSFFVSMVRLSHVAMFRNDDEMQDLTAADRETRNIKSRVSGPT